MKEAVYTTSTEGQELSVEGKVRSQEAYVFPMLFIVLFKCMRLMLNATYTR